MTPAVVPERPQAELVDSPRPITKTLRWLPLICPVLLHVLWFYAFISVGHAPHISEGTDDTFSLVVANLFWLSFFLYVPFTFLVVVLSLWLFISKPPEWKLCLRDMAIAVLLCVAVCALAASDPFGAVEWLLD